MRELLKLLAIAVVVMLLLRLNPSRGQFGSGPYPDLPRNDWFTSQAVAPSRTQPVLVKFGASWCGPCQAMEAQLDGLERSLPGQVRVLRIDTDEHPDLAQHYGVSGIPHTFVMSDGAVVSDQVGYLSQAELSDWLTPWLR